jgi:hypothetical protein
MLALTACVREPIAAVSVEFKTDLLPQSDRRIRAGQMPLIGQIFLGAHFQTLTTRLFTSGVQARNCVRSGTCCTISGRLGLLKVLVPGNESVPVSVWQDPGPNFYNPSEVRR